MFVSFSKSSPSFTEIDVSLIFPPEFFATLIFALNLLPFLVTDSHTILGLFASISSKTLEFF